MAFRTEFSWMLSGVMFACLFTETYAREVSRASDQSDVSLDLGVIVGGLASLVVLVVVVALCAQRRVRVENLDKGPPYWTRSLVLKPEFNGGLSAVSDGINNLSPFHVVRDRLGRTHTDGARWDVGFTGGKHVFEVVWPAKNNRGPNCSIGVGTLDVPLKKQGRLSLAGDHSQSWGYDLSSRRVVTAGKVTGNFARPFPDRFFLYLDMDSGKIGFGDDVRTHGRQALFYGNIVNGIRVEKDKPKYLMISMCSPKEEAQVYYIGTATPQGGFDLVPPEQGPSVPSNVTMYTDGNVTVTTAVQHQVPTNEEKGQQPGDVPQQATY